MYFSFFLLLITNSGNVDNNTNLQFLFFFFSRDLMMPPWAIHSKTDSGLWPGELGQQPLQDAVLAE